MSLAPSPSARRPTASLTARSLVLNVTFQAISIVSARRALMLVLMDKAESVHEGDDLVRSESLEVAVPSVVRLRYFVHVPYRRPGMNGRTVLARDDFTCQYCAGLAECIDHVHPRSRGGGDNWENVVACCRSCNVRKGDRLLVDLPMRLARQPFTPDVLAVTARGRGAVPAEWAQYLPALTSGAAGRLFQSV